MKLLVLDDLRIKTLSLTSDIPYMYIADIDKDGDRAKFISQLLQHRTGLKIPKDQTIINANHYDETL